MTPDERARARADIQTKLDGISARLERRKARDAERERLKIQSHLASERLHQAVQALRAATPGR